MLKIEDVKAGDELVCIKRDGIAHTQIGAIEKFIVEGVCDGAVLIKDTKYQITDEYFDCFKKKEQSQQYTFDDLIDVAVQAYKDGVAAVKIDTKLHTVFVEELKTTYGIGHIDLGIKNIQSLYKETFVIESHEDIRRIKNDANITLSNGNRIEQAVHENWDDYIVFNDSSDDVYTFNFMVLKGATVEQERGRDD